MAYGIRAAVSTPASSEPDMEKRAPRDKSKAPDTPIMVNPARAKGAVEWESICQGMVPTIRKLVIT